MLIEFVTFHVAMSGADAVHPNQTLAHQEYLSMIDMMFASARLQHPRARRTVLSDARTALDAIARRLDAVERREMDCSQLMLERAVSQERHLMRSAFDRPMVVLDSDILLNAPLSDLFARDFDVALTWRGDNPAQPINGGFMILNNRRPEVVRAFFARYMDLFRGRYAKTDAGWFGDQLALRDSLGLTATEMQAQPMVDVAGCRVLLLPCDTHNFSPANRYAEIVHPAPGRAVLHFKGERKRLMAPYWEAWLAPRASWSLRTHWQAQRVRQRLHALAAAETVRTAPERGPNLA